MKIFIVIPAYNEVQRIHKVLLDLKKYKLKIVVVDDGSKDGTYDVVKKHRVVALKHKINLGKGAALKTGCEAAIMMGAEAIILMDSDGQHKVSDLPKFIEKLETVKYDVIFGSRLWNMSAPVIRFTGNKLVSVLISLMFNIYVSDILCGFRAFHKSAYQKLKWESLGYTVETEMVIRAGKHKLRRCEIPVEAVYLDKFKGVTIFDAFGIFFDIFKMRINL